MVQAFRHLDRRGVGKVNVADALRAVRGEINTRRADAIDEAFDALLFRGHDGSGDGGKDNQTLEPSTVAKLFRAEQHPDVLSGARAQGEVSSEFLEAFDGGGEIIGRVTRTEWREHHLYVSALIPDDDVFCEQMKRLWGYDGGKDVGRKLSKSNDSSFRRSTLSGVHSSPTPNSNGVTGDAEEQGGNATIGKSNSDGQGYHKDRAGTTAASPAIREAWALTSRPASAVERSPILQQDHPREATAARSNVPPGIIGILRRVRSSLAAGGMRAAFQLLKDFRKGDQEGNGKVELSAFKKAVGGASLGLKEAEMRIVFQHFDRGADGEVPYESFLRHIREPLPEGRLALAHEVFDRMGR
ncbi:unnamed protein product, partial [Hapterophycus canaliculatus]